MSYRDDHFGLRGRIAQLEEELRMKNENKPTPKWPFAAALLIAIGAALYCVFVGITCMNPGAMTPDAKCYAAFHPYVFAFVASVAVAVFAGLFLFDEMP